MTACKWADSDQPRILPGRHEAECESETCAGCQPCHEPHCRVCGIEHNEHTCPGCLDAARESLSEIARLCDALPDEVEHRGVDGEAFVLLGPVADPEARGHLEASVRAGRVPPEYLEVVDNEQHPEFVAERWGSVYREAFDHDEPIGRVNLADELGYLDRNLTYMATWPHVPFEDFAKDLRRCVAHLESVLGDSERGERTNIDCLDCGGALERRLGTKGFEDVATCRGCKRRLTAAEYQFAVTADYIERATWLSDDHMAQRTGVLASTVRSWARTPKDDAAPLVRKELQHGRTVYSVADVELVKVKKGLAA